MSTKVRPHTTADLRQVVEQATDAFTHARSRLVLLRKIAAEMKSVGIDGEFLVDNELVYRMVGDTFQLCVIDFASLCKGLCEDGGYISQLNNHLSKFALPSKKMRKEVAKPVWDTVFVPKEARLRRLFPGMTGRQAQQRDTKALGGRVAALSEKAMKLRHRFAHRHENGPIHAQASLSLGELDRMFDQLEEILGDVYLLVTGGQLDFTSITYSSAECTSQDLVDLILHGNMFRVDDRFFHRDQEAPRSFDEARNAFYASERWKAERRDKLNPPKRDN